MPSVSTGTFIIAYVDLLIWSFFFFERDTPAYFSWRRFTLFLLLALSFPLLFLSLIKNLIFFGGNLNAIFSTLNHGFGHYVFSLYGLVGALGLIVMWSLRNYYLPRNGNNFVLLTALLGLIGGTYGYSTLMSAIPSLAILIYLKIGEFLQGTTLQWHPVEEVHQ